MYTLAMIALAVAGIGLMVYFYLNNGATWTEWHWVVALAGFFVVGAGIASGLPAEQTARDPEES